MVLQIVLDKKPERYVFSVGSLPNCAELVTSEFAELNTPPIISLGTIYPQALLIFLMCLTFSVIAPLILLFGTIYFGMGYLVYKVVLFADNSLRLLTRQYSINFFSFTSAHLSLADRLGPYLSLVSVGD